MSEEDDTEKPAAVRSRRRQRRRVARRNRPSANRSEAGAPDRAGLWAGRALIAAWVLATPVLGALYLAQGATPAEALTAYLAWAAGEGAALYDELFLPHAPGLALIHGVGQAFAGAEAWSYRLIDFALIQATALGGVLLLRRAGCGAGAYTLLLLYPAVCVTQAFGVSGERDIVAAGLSVLAAALSMPGGRREALGLVAAGAISGLAALVAPWALAVAAGLVAVEALPVADVRPRRLVWTRRMALVGAGLALALGGYAVAAYAPGRAGAAWEQAILFPGLVGGDAGLVQLGRTLAVLVMVSWHWIAALAAAGAVAWLATGFLTRRRDGRRMPSRALVLWGWLALVAGAAFVIRAEPVGHMLGGLVPVMALAAAVLFDRIGRLWARRPVTAGALLGLCGAVAVAGTGYEALSLRDEARRLVLGQPWPVTADPGAQLSRAEIAQAATILRTSTRGHETLLVWGPHHEVAMLARRRSPTRFVGSAATLAAFDPGQPLTRRWLEMLSRELEASPPAFALIDRSALSDRPGRIAPRADAPPALVRLLEPLADYELAAAYRSAVLLRRPDG